MSVNVSDPRIAEAYNAVRKDGDPTNWFLCGYTDNKTIQFIKSGGSEQPVEDMAANMKNNGCYYGYVRFNTKFDETARTKFVLITFKGDDAPVMRKGKMSVDVASVKSIIRDFSIEYSAATTDEVTESHIMKKLKSANY